MTAHPPPDPAGPNPLDAAMRAAFGPGKDPPSVHDVVARLTGAATKVSLREARDNTPAPMLKPSALPRALRADGRTSYQLLGEIARGGMGVILRGHDQDLGRDVAMKVLHEKLAARPEMVQRFVEEAQIGGQLQHPGIVPVYELALMADQRPYFTMKLVKGSTLAALLVQRAGNIERRRLLAVFEAVCQTMAYAHSRGVIHRDLKPANVMVGAFGEVQVVDWGLAKVLRSGGIDDEQRSRSQRATAISIIETVRSAPGSSGSHSVVGSVLGTPAYMSPEQARGDVDSLDERSDVFSLGAMLCELLTGAPPYIGASERTLELAAQGKLDDAFARLDACGADDELVALAKQCLTPAPAARPRSAEVLAERLHAHLTSVESRAQSARVEAAEARAKALAERRAHRLTLSLAVMMLVFVMLGGGGFWWFEKRESDRRRQTEQAVTASLGDASLARGRQDWTAAHAALERANARLDAGDAPPELRAEVSRLRGLIQSEAAAATAAARLQADNEALLAALQDVRQPDGHEKYPTDWVKLDVQYRAIATAHALDVDAGEVAAAAARLAARGIAVELAAAFDEWALVRSKAGNLEGCARLSALARSLDTDPVRTELRSALARKDVATLRRLAAGEAVRTLAAPTLRLLALGLREGGAEDATLAVLTAGRLQVPKDFTLAMELARTLTRMQPRRAQEAVAHYTAALALRPDSVEAWHELGLTLDRYLGQHDHAVELFRTACARWPQDAHLQWHFAWVLGERGELENAAAGYRRAIELDPASSEANRDLGRLLEQQGQLDQAIANYRRAIELEESCALRYYLGRALADRGNLDEAIVNLRRAIELEPRDSRSHNNLGKALAQQGRLDEAIASFRRALEYEPGDAAAYNGLGAAVAQQGNLDEAIGDFRRAVELDPKLSSARINLGIALAKNGDADGAIAVFRSAVELDPKLAMAHWSLGIALDAAGDHDGAIASHRRAVELGVKEPRTLNAVAWWLVARQGAAASDAKEAVRLARSAVQQVPTEATFWNTLGVALCRAEEWTESIAALERSMKLGNGGEAADWLFLAMAHHRLQHADEARTWYQRAIAWWATQPAVDDELQRFRAEAEKVLGIKPGAEKD